MKSEKEKAAEGRLYDPNNNKQLQDEMYQARCLIYRYNSLPPWDKDEREKLIDCILKIGKNGCIISPFYCDYGYNIHIGDNFFANTNLVILDGAKVTIGNNVFIAPNVGIYTAGHPLDVEQRNQGLEYAFPISIGNNVWIGAQVCILPGVNIGDNSVIGAGSVVTQNIPSDTVAAGNPCRVIRQITKEDKNRYKI